MEERSVVLIVLDSLRKDYGDKYIWPVLKKYGFVKFDNAVSTATWTVPSHASMFTGLYPFQHRVHPTESVPISLVRFKPTDKYLLNQIKRNTVLITANSLVTPLMGFRGFDVVKELENGFFMDPIKMLLSEKEVQRVKRLLEERGLRYSHPIRKFLYLIKVGEISTATRLVLRETMKFVRGTSFVLTHPNWPLEKGVTQAINWLQARKLQQPFFLFMNLMEMHEPYEKTFYTDAYITKIVRGDVDEERWKTGYERAAIYLSKKLDRLLSILHSNYDNLLIIVTADHGQLLGENGLWSHGRFLHPILLRVPLYIRFPENPEELWTSTKDGFVSLRKIYDIVLTGRPPKPEPLVISELYACQTSKSIHEPCHKVGVFYNGNGEERFCVVDMKDKRSDCPPEVKKKVKLLIIGSRIRKNLIRK